MWKSKCTLGSLAVFPHRLTNAGPAGGQGSPCSRPSVRGSRVPRPAWGPRCLVMVPPRGTSCQADRGRCPASSYPQMPAWPGPGSSHQLQEGRASGDSLPMELECWGLCPDRSSASSGLLFAHRAEVLQNLCVHLKVHHCLGRSLTRSQTCSIKPTALAGKGGKVQEVLAGFLTVRFQNRAAFVLDFLTFLIRV